MSESTDTYFGTPQLAGPISGEKDLRTGRNINPCLLNIYPTRASLQRTRIEIAGTNDSDVARLRPNVSLFGSEQSVM